MRVRSSYCTGVNLERFESQRGADWARLEALLAAGARRSPAGAGGSARDGVLELGALYRGAAADLAYARRRFPGDPVVARLEALVTRGRAAVYGRAGAARQRPGVLRARLLAPARGAARHGGARLGAAAGARRGRRDLGPGRPGRRRRAGPGDFAAAADPPAAGRDFGAGEGSVFATQVLVNNIQVTLIAFVGGLLFGLGTVAALVFNGLLLGVIGGLAFGAGNGEAFVRLISSHGPLELSCIVVGGVAGPAARASR